MEKILICYFSATGITKEVSKKIQETIGGPLFEIEPTKIYTKEDLDWTNKNSRSTIEMKDKTTNCNWNIIESIYEIVSLLIHSKQNGIFTNSLILISAIIKTFYKSTIFIVLESFDIIISET